MLSFTYKTGINTEKTCSDKHRHISLNRVCINKITQGYQEVKLFQAAAASDRVAFHRVPFTISVFVTSLLVTV